MQRKEKNHKNQYKLSQLFVKTNSINKLLINLGKIKREITQVNTIRIGKEDISTNTNEIQKKY